MAAGRKRGSSGKRARSSRRRSKGRSSEGQDRSSAVDLGTDKLYFKIGEVAEIVDVAPHVLRYWESEFSIIKPQKSRSQQRVYRRKDVENLLRIKHLLYERKFTIAGARQELRKGAAQIEAAAANELFRARASFARVREQLDLLAATVRSEPEPAHLAADPAAFLRAVGGVEGVLRGETPSRPNQPLLDRPQRKGE